MRSKHKHTAEWHALTRHSSTMWHLWLNAETTNDRRGGQTQAHLRMAHSDQSMCGRAAQKHNRLITCKSCKVLGARHRMPIGCITAKRHRRADQSALWNSDASNARLVELRIERQAVSRQSVTGGPPHSCPGSQSTVMQNSWFLISETPLLCCLFLLLNLGLAFACVPVPFWVLPGSRCGTRHDRV